MDIIRFGPGHRRAGGPSGSRGVSDRVVWSDGSTRVTELAFARRALLAPQMSPDTALFLVISGGGWVQVDDERAGINHGEAVVWPPGVAHGAWTDGSEMRAILVESRAVDASGRHVRVARPSSADASVPAARGGLAPREIRPDEHDTSEGEPW